MNEFCNVTFNGFLQENQRVSVRNHVIVFAAERLCTNIGRQICANVSFAKFLYHPLGRGEIGVNKTSSSQMIQKILTHPNIFGIVLIGYEEEDCRSLHEAIEDDNIPVQRIGVNQSGNRIEAIAKGMEQTGELVLQSSELRRTNISVEQLKVGVIADPDLKLSEVLVYAQIIEKMSSYLQIYMTEENGGVILNSIDKGKHDILIISGRGPSPQQSATELVADKCHLLVYFGDQSVSSLPIVPLIRVSNNNSIYERDVTVVHPTAKNILDTIISVSSGESTYSEILGAEQSQVWLPKIKKDIYI